MFLCSQQIIHTAKVPESVNRLEVRSFGVNFLTFLHVEEGILGRLAKLYVYYSPALRINYSNSIENV